jgi:four helix bundle protein
VKRKHHDLIVWKESVELVKEIYDLTANFPKEEIYSLTSQIRRSAISVPSNIAEGAARTTNKEFINFLSISRGSLSVLETHIIIAKKIGYLDNASQIMETINKIFALINGLINSVKKRDNVTEAEK